jgi:NitT/TauT family transport system permease protein
MLEASRIYRYSAWQRFWQLEMPYAAIGLVWNSIVSVAGGWFALIACEMFTMGDRNFQLARPGQLHANRHQLRRCARAAGRHRDVILIVVATDQLVWRPLIAWSDKFKFEQVESADRVTSPILELLRRSKIAQFPSRPHLESREEPIYRRMAQPRNAAWSAARRDETGKGCLRRCGRWPSWRHLCVVLGSAAGRPHAQHRHLADLRCCSKAPRNLSARQCRAAHLRRVDHSRRRGHRLQPAARAHRAAARAGLASVPATAFFPILLIGLVKIGGGLGIGSIALMLLGTQWYILFNVIAGAMSIPSDLREVASLYHFTRWQRWTKLILPGIFPYLITGMVTASGGAWNASVLAEYSHVQRASTLSTIGLGAQIDAATDSGRFPCCCWPRS